MKRLLNADRVWGHEGSTALLIDGGVIRAIGTREHLIRSADEVIEVAGTLVPGLTDHHIHPNALAATALSVNLGKARDIADIVEMFDASSAVMGHSLDESILTEGRLPTAVDLEAIKRPVLLMRRCGHIAVANRAALALAGLDRGTVDPENGTIDRYDSGEPTGVVRESAVSLLTEALQGMVPPPDAAQLMSTFRHLLDLGITAVQAIASTNSPLWCGSGREVDSLMTIADDVPVDIDMVVATTSVSELIEVAARLPKGRIKFGGWKGFADGSLGGRTAAVSESYLDGGRGMMVLPENARALAEAARKLGGIAAIHAIGDRAVDAVVDLFASLDGGAAFRIEHASLVSDATLERIADLDLTASVQPAFPVSDKNLLTKSLPPRLREIAYRFVDMESAGVHMVGGSDAPVEDPSPWVTLDATGLPDPLSLYTRPMRPGDTADLVVRTDHAITAVWKNGVAQS